MDVIYVDSDLLEGSPETCPEVKDAHVISLVSSPDRSLFTLSSDNLEPTYSDCEIVSQQASFLEPSSVLANTITSAATSSESQKRTYDALSPMNVAAKRTFSAPALSPLITRTNRSSDHFEIPTSSPITTGSRFALKPTLEIPTSSPPNHPSLPASQHHQEEAVETHVQAPASPEISAPSSPLAQLELNAPESPTPARRSKTTGSLPPANLIAKTRAKPKSRAKPKAVKKMTDRKETAKSMICDIKGDLEIVAEIEKALNEAEIKNNVTKSSAYDGLVIHLSRTSTDTFDEEEDMFVPCAAHTELETTAIAIIDAKVFLQVLLDEAKHDAYFDNLQQTIGTPTVLYIVQGIQSIIKKSINEHNKLVQARARAYMGGQQQLAPLTPLKAVNHEVISAAQTKLQVQKGVRVIYSANTAQTTEWVVNLVQDVSLARYQTKYSQQPTVKSGKTDADCVVETLAKIKMITPSIATRIRSEFPNMGALLTSLHTEGPLALTAKGVVGDRMASSMHALLCATDPDQLV